MTLDLSSFLSRCVSPAGHSVPFPEPEQKELFIFCPPVIGDELSFSANPMGQSIIEMNSSAPPFWRLLARMSHDFEQIPWYQRLNSVFVNPQFAISGRSQKNGLNQLIGRMTRGAHTVDSEECCVADLKRRLDSGEKVSAELCVYQTLGIKGHDIEHSGLSHLAQDALYDRGINIDHDLKLLFGRSQRWAKEFCARWGLDEKLFIVAGLPPEFLSLSREEKVTAWESFRDSLAQLIHDSPERWLYYKKKYDLGETTAGAWEAKLLDSSITFKDCLEEVAQALDLSKDSPDHVLLEDPQWITNALRIHEDFDESYVRLDHSQSSAAEYTSVSMLEHGLLSADKIYSLEKIDLLSLPRRLRTSLSGTGSIPTGKLFTAYLNDAGIAGNEHGLATHLCLLEEKEGEYILRAINTEPQDDLVAFVDRSSLIEGLTRVKAPKTMSRYGERLKYSTPMGDGTYLVENLHVLVRDRASLGDFQSSLVASPQATLGRAFFESAILQGNEGKGIPSLDLVFGTHKEIVDQFSKRHKKVVEEGYEDLYEPLVKLTPHSSSAGHHRIGPGAPKSESIKELFRRIDHIVNEFRTNLLELDKSVEVISAPSAPVIKSKHMKLTGDALKQLDERFVVDSVTNNRSPQWYRRQSRMPTDLFSLGIKVLSQSELENKNPALLTDGFIHAELIYHLHRGFVVAVHRDDWSKINEDDFNQFKRELDVLVSTFEIECNPLTENESPTKCKVHELFQLSYF